MLTQCVLLLCSWTITDVFRLPAEVCQLEFLEEISLDFSPIQSLPRGLEHCKAVKVLRLYRTQITALPALLPPNIESLSVTGIGLRALPENIGDLTSLRDLAAQENRLSALPDSFANLHNLEQLTIHFNNITVWPPFLRSLHTQHKLKWMNLFANPASINGASVESLLGLQCDVTYGSGPDFNAGILTSSHCPCLALPCALWLFPSFSFVDDVVLLVACA